MNDIFVRNPSEFQRMAEERNDQYRVLMESKNRLATEHLPKAAKERLLGEVRRLENEIGVESHSYNSEDF